MRQPTMDLTVFKLKKRKFCAPPAQAQGLYLEKIIY